MDWFWNNFGGVITTVLAIYGAFLSSLNFWYMWKRDRKKLYIEAIYNPSNVVKLNDVKITVVNESRRPITVKEVGLKYPPSVAAKLSKPKEEDNGRSRLPQKLRTADQFECYVLLVYYDDEKEQHYNLEVSAIPYAIDNEGQQYVGEPLKHQVFFIPCSKSDTDKDNKSEHQQD